jgi:L-tartrate/succinate antiporter
MNKKLIAAAAGPLVALIIAAIPAPGGLTQNAWWFFALFVGVIVALIFEPIPAAAVGFIGVTVAVTLRLIGENPADALKWGLSGFSDSTVWLIFAAFMFAEGYEKTGLGKRLALLLVKYLGKSTLGLGYAVSLADLVLAPFIPSNTARSGGTVFPIVKSIPPLYGSTPENEPEKIGSYLMYTALAATCVTSSMFSTALAPNVLALSIVEKTTNVHIKWMDWFTGFLPIGLILFLLVPVLLYYIFPPKIKKGGEVVAWASNALDEMGALSRAEITMAALAVLALVLWIWGGKLVTATTAAMIVISAMLLLRVLTWSDLLGNTGAWNVLVWFATLVALADGLNKVGFLPWAAKHLAASLGSFSPITVTIALVAIFFLLHYLFASVTAHATALLPVFIATAQAVPGVNVGVTTLLLCYSLGIMGILTPYATGPSPIYFGSGYVKSSVFWKYGAVLGALFLLVLLGVGVPYLSARGF